MVFLPAIVARLERTVLIKTIDPSTMYASVSFVFDRPDRAADRYRLLASVSRDQRTKRTLERPINFVAACPPAIKIRELELRKLVRQCHRDVKTCFLPTARGGTYMYMYTCMYIYTSTEKKAAGIRRLTIERWPQATTLLGRSCAEQGDTYVCAREGEYAFNCVPVHTD